MGCGHTNSFIGYQLKNLGDAIMCLPALGFLKRELNAHITLVVRPQIAPLLIGSPFIDVVLMTGHKSKAYEIGATFKLAAKIQEREYRAAFGFDHKGRSGYLALLAGQKERYASQILGYETPHWPWKRLEEPYSMSSNYRESSNYIYIDSTKNLSGSNYLASTHMADSQGLMVASALGLNWQGVTKELVPRLAPPSPEAKSFAQELLNLAGNAIGPKVGLCLRGLQPEKSWPLGDMALVARRLHSELKATLFVTGLASDGPLYSTLASIAGVPICDLTGKTSLLELWAVLGELDLFISVDTGASHLAGLAGAKLVTIYTATNPAQWRPFAEKSRILCYNWALARFGLPLAPKALSPWESYCKVGPQEVFRAARSLLESD